MSHSILQHAYFLNKPQYFSDDLTEKEIEIKLEISKKAGLLRKPVRFVDVPGRIDESIPPNESLWLQYIDRNPVHRCIQVAADCSMHEINTFRAEYLSQGMIGCLVAPNLWESPIPVVRGSPIPDTPVPGFPFGNKITMTFLLEITSQG